MSLGDSEWVFAHDQLEVPELVHATDGDRWVLVHGLCLFAGENEQDLSPAQRLTEAAIVGETKFLNLLDYFGGRHVVLSGDANGFSLYQDATGMRSVYYSKSNALIASHANLLNELVPHRRRSPQEGLNGFMRAWDRTPYIGIDALLPNHALNVPGFDFKRFFPRQNNKFRSWTVQERITEFRKLWDQNWTSLAKSHTEIVMSITGGHDSRTTLALLSHQIHSIRTFTYTTSGSAKDARESSLHLDRIIVDEIKKYISLDHEYIMEPEKRPILEEQISALLSKNTLGKHGRWLLPYYLDMAISHEAVHVRGNAYGVYKIPWRPKSDQDSLEEFRKLYFRLTKSDQTHEPESSRNAHFVEGLQRWGYEEALYDYHRFELLFWEIRLGRWASEIYNETDIAFNSLEPTNVRRMLEIATSFTYPEKVNMFFQSELINSTYPLLNFPGKNDVRNLYEITRDNLKVNQSVTSQPYEPGGTRMGLAKTFRIEKNDGTFIDEPAYGNEISIPAQNFHPGNSVTRKFNAIKESGDLTFTLSNTYANPNGRGVWRLEILLDNVPAFCFDGAERHRPVHILVANLSSKTQVAIRLIPLQNRTGKQSWARASRTQVYDAFLSATHTVGPLEVHADIDGFRPIDSQ
ncbi:hypothetical protein RF638_10405 [Kocuria sp. CPCC 205235]|uniref:hypothetical protein n=1 Tax=Kocuria sp. CPCC 205235 TaxID=3073549 RepID=UPI0034D4F6F5